MFVSSSTMETKVIHYYTIHKYQIFPCVIDIWPNGLWIIGKEASLIIFNKQLINVAVMSSLCINSPSINRSFLVAPTLRQELYKYERG